MLPKDIQRTVLDKIRKREVVMRPKVYFVLKIIFVAAISVVAFLLSIYVASFIFFSLHESGEQFLLGFGFRGILIFISLFPWWALIVVILLIFAVEYFIHRFRFVYRVSLSKVFAAALLLAIVLGVVLDFSPLHTVMLELSDKGQLPIFGGAYESIRAPHRDQGVFRGIVDSISPKENTFVISHDDFDNDQDDGVYTVIAPQGFSTNSLKIGDRVYVAGIFSQNTINAYGIEPFGK